MAQPSRTQLAVLQALSTGRTHAYEIKMRLSGELGHSSVYAALASAASKGFVSAEWEAPGARPPGSGPLRKYYELTAAGRRVLEQATQAEPKSSTPPRHAARSLRAGS